MLMLGLSVDRAQSCCLQGTAGHSQPARSLLLCLRSATRGGGVWLEPIGLIDVEVVPLRVRLNSCGCRFEIAGGLLVLTAWPRLRLLVSPSQGTGDTHSHSPLLVHPHTLQRTHDSSTCRRHFVPYPSTHCWPCPLTDAVE